MRAVLFADYVKVWYTVFIPWERTVDMSTDNNRNYGIDLLRIVSMLLVVVLHVLGQGGILGKTGDPALGNQSLIAWFMETAAYCAVNVYALISGYVGVRARFRWSRIIPLWLTVLFYSVLIYAAVRIWQPDWLNSGYSLRLVLLPASSGEYWYFTAYVGVFVLSPFLNKLLLALDDRGLKRLIAVIVIVFSVWNSYPTIDLFKTTSGYSAWWLMLLYLLGGALRQLNVADRVPKWKSALAYVACVMLSWGVRMVIPGLSIPNLRADILCTYYAPTIVGSAVALLLFFSRCRFGNVANRLIRFGSPLAFSVYLIHVHPLIFGHWLKDAFVPFSYYSPLHLIGAVAVVVLAIYLACSAIDLVRFYLFKLCRISALCDKLEAFVHRTFGKKTPAP